MRPSYITMSLDTTVKKKTVHIQYYEN